MSVLSLASAELKIFVYSGGTKQGYMHGEDYEEGTAEYNAELARLTALAQEGVDNWDAGDKA